MIQNTEGRKKWIQRPVRARSIMPVLIGLSFASILLVTAFAASHALAAVRLGPSHAQDQAQRIQGNDNTRSSFGSSGPGQTIAAAPSIPDHVRLPSRPNLNDSFLYLTPNTTDTPGTCPAPAEGGSVAVGCTFAFNLILDAGTYAAPLGVTAQQSYLTFTYQSVGVSRFQTTTVNCVITNVLPFVGTFDGTVFEVNLQNLVCNSQPGGCVIQGNDLPNGSIAYASGALQNCAFGGCPDPDDYPPPDPQCCNPFRVGRIPMCALAPGAVTLHWQFSEPSGSGQTGCPRGYPAADVTRDTEIVIADNSVGDDCFLFIDYHFTVAGGPPTLTPTPGTPVGFTPTPTVTQPAATITPTRTNTPPAVTLTPTNTPPAATITPTRTFTATNTPPAVTFTPTNTPPAATITPTRTFTATNTPPATSTPPGPTSTPGGPTNTPTNTQVAPSATRTSPPAATSTRTRTSVPVSATRTFTPAATSTPCVITFTDVHASPTPDYFYDAVHYMYCGGIISGYADNTFRPYNTTTRAQVSKILVLSKGWTIDVTDGPHFADVPTSNVFYDFVETVYRHGAMSGYACGGTGEPCGTPPKPYFRPENMVTRAQLCKIVVVAMLWALDHDGPHFSDVAPGSPFYNVIETAANHGIISGYTCGGSGEQCDSQNRPYFRPDKDATRGQISKVIYLAVTNRRE